MLAQTHATTSQGLKFRGFGNIVPGAFTPVLAKHTKSFNLIDTLSVGVDRIQRNFEPLQRQVELWRKTQITDDTAKLDPLLRVHRWQPGGAQKPAARSPSAVFRAAILGLLGQDDVELVERLYQRLQETRSGPAVQGNGQAGRLSRTMAGIIKAGPVLGDHHPERVRLIAVRTALGNPYPFRQFPEASLWIASGWPTIRPKPDWQCERSVELALEKQAGLP